MFVWLERAGSVGALVPAEEASISVLDRGLTVGDGVFETLKVVHGRPFALSRHLERLRSSAAAMSIDVPSEDALRTAIEALLSAEAEQVGPLGRLRLTVTQGTGVLGDPYAGDGTPTVLVTVVSSRPWPPSSVVALSPFRRNEHSALTGVKSTSYAENAIALREAKERGADEALLLNTAGEVCEGTGSNIFLVIDGEVCTPGLESGCLAGITRELALSWCGGREDRLPREALSEATEAFLTSSTRDIHPIRVLDGRSLPSPGPSTTAAMAAWRDAEQVTWDP